MQRNEKGFPWRAASTCLFHPEGEFQALLPVSARRQRSSQPIRWSDPFPRWTHSSNSLAGHTSAKLKRTNSLPQDAGGQWAWNRKMMAFPPLLLPPAAPPPQHQSKTTLPTAEQDNDTTRKARVLVSFDKDTCLRRISPPWFIDREASDVTPVLVVVRRGRSYPPLKIWPH